MSKENTLSFISLLFIFFIQKDIVTLGELVEFLSNLSLISICLVSIIFSSFVNHQKSK